MPNHQTVSATKRRFQTRRLRGEIEHAALVPLARARPVEGPPLPPSAREREAKLAAVSVSRSRAIVTAAFRLPCPEGCAPALAWCFRHVKGLCSERYEAGRVAAFPLEPRPMVTVAGSGALAFRHVNRQQRGRL
jgi:hypothetical protein